MIEDQELKKTLIEVIEIVNSPEGRIYGTGLWKKCHILAKNHYLPAKELFIKMLSDNRWDWRRESVSLLGFHYKLDHKIIEKIREMLLSDIDSGVRIACASVLGIHSYYNDPALVASLENDDNSLVKEAAFISILDLAKVPNKHREIVLGKIRSGELSLTLIEVQLILAELNLDL